MKFKKLFSRLLLATGIMFAGTFTYQNIEHTHVSKAASYITIRKVNVLGGHINAVLNLANLFQIVGEMQKTGITTQNALVTELVTRLNATQ